MRRFAFAFAFLFAFALATSNALANNPNNPESYQELITIYNNSGSALTSGTVVIWDTTGTAGTTLGGYVTTTTSADSNLAAGVVVSDSIPASERGVICTKGPCQVLMANSTDGTAAAGTPIGTSTVAGQAGNAASDAPIVGTSLQTSAVSSDTLVIWAYINPQSIP